jgi:hypothetical protein
MGVGVGLGVGVASACIRRAPNTSVRRGSLAVAIELNARAAAAANIKPFMDSPRNFQTRELRSRSAFAMTDTELSVIAALASIGDKSSPKSGKRMPAATGTPTAL